MKKRIALSLSLFSAMAFADPSVFGMELGKMTESELKSAYDVRHIGTNKYSGGNMYSIPKRSINFDGVKEVTTVFDQNNKLVAVLTTLPKSKFEYINGALGNKYKQVSSKIPFVGDKSVKYRDGIDVRQSFPIPKQVG